MQCQLLRSIVDSKNSKAERSKARTDGSVTDTSRPSMKKIIFNHPISYKIDFSFDEVVYRYLRGVIKELDTVEDGIDEAVTVPLSELQTQMAGTTAVLTPSTYMIGAVLSTGKSIINSGLKQSNSTFETDSNMSSCRIDSDMRVTATSSPSIAETEESKLGDEIAFTDTSLPTNAPFDESLDSASYVPSTTAIRNARAIFKERSLEGSSNPFQHNNTAAFSDVIGQTIANQATNIAKFVSTNPSNINC